MFKSRIFKTRYQAIKARRTEPFFNGAEVCVKVCSGVDSSGEPTTGYVLMDAEDYRVWRGQK